VPFSSILRRVALVRTHVSYERISGVILVSKNGAANVSTSPIRFNLMMEALRSSETSVCYKSHNAQHTRRLHLSKTDIPVDVSRPMPVRVRL
jgi:hypothetical protein